ncbi:protein of unknown function [Sinomicrobium oceani]|uniref:Uncharacterized protein n=1 Tax=Sinomicrobium oceani TaxID=1150368 RepID=A0A1K1R5I1_9FLAO|nr:DUF3857 and transglutaminase domain-containing protein [Sinomicrobium oceani]SFW67490.1 protein of unknown function [Sinomicrobium oceani]
MKRTLLCFILIGFFQIDQGLAQNYKFGKVSEEELEETVNPQDSSAHASILYKKVRVHYRYNPNDGFELITDVQERVKIYTREGFDYATRQISYYSPGSGGEEKVTGLKAYTYNLKNGKIEEEKLSKSEIFDEEKSKYWGVVKFTMPDIRPGSVIEYSYSINSPFLGNIEEIDLQYDIPVKKIEVQVESPEYFVFKPLMKGYYPFQIISDSKRESINFTNKSRTSGISGKTSYSSSRVDYTTNISKIDLENVPALKEEPYVNNINNYRSAIRYELQYVQFPQTPIKYYSSSWTDVAKTIYDNSSFGNELKKTGYFEDEINGLLQGVNSPSEKIAVIFQYVKNRMNWNGYFGYYCDEGVRRAYKDKVGNVAEINLMLTAMLRYAGLDANPVLVSTRSHGIPLFPTREGFNYVISAVSMDEGYVLLDGTAKFSVPGMLPPRAHNWNGRLIKKEGASEEISLTPRAMSKEMISVTYKLTEDGAAEGKIRKQFTDHHALSFRQKYFTVDEEQYIQDLENKYSGMEISEYTLQNKEDISQPVIETFSFFKENACDLIADKVYLSPMLFFAMEENPFKLEKREYPIDFSYPWADKYIINIGIPEGYKAEILPEPSRVTLPEDLGSFLFNINESGAMIQVMVQTEMTSAILPAVYYDTVREFFKQLVAKETEKIVLTKI